MSRAHLASRLCLVVVFSCAVFAQDPARPSGETSANLPSQPIGANDLIAVSVYGSPELTRTVRVGPDGQIRLPMLKRRIKADGLLPVDLEAAITEALVSERILVEPYVTVTMAEYHSRPISIAGAVKRPATFQAVGPMTLLEALARAEGLRDDAGQEILVSRTRPGADGKSSSLVQRIPVKGLIDAADPALNVKLTGGEEIRVPEAGKIYVVGNVKKPGAFPVQETAETTVLQALALAEGVLPYAYRQAFIYRREANGAKNEIPIELEKIIKRQAPDARLLANDILYIPDNKGRRAAIQTIDRIMSFGAGTASGVLIYRR